MSPLPKPAIKRARASSTGEGVSAPRPDVPERRAAEVRLNGPESLAEVATLQRWANAGRMIGSAAHEMRGALAAAQMNLEYLSAELRKPSPEQAPEELSLAAEEARQGIARALAAAQGVLSLALGRQPAVVPVSVADAVERAIAAVAPRMRGLPPVEVRCEGAPLVEVEAGALHHALVNLLLNAADAVCEARPEGRVRVAISAGAEAVRIAVSDNGCVQARDARGLPASPVPRRDAGLGLALSRTVVQAFGGELTCAEGGPLGGWEYTLLLYPAGNES